MGVAITHRAWTVVARGICEICLHSSWSRPQSSKNTLAKVILHFPAVVLWQYCSKILNDLCFELIRCRCKITFLELERWRNGPVTTVKWLCYYGIDYFAVGVSFSTEEYWRLLGRRIPESGAYGCSRWFQGVAAIILRTLVSKVQSAWISGG